MFLFCSPIAVAVRIRLICPSTATASADVQVPLTVVQAANLMAISTWYGNLMLQAKSSTARKRREPELLAKQNRWMDGQQMLQVAHQFLLEGGLSSWSDKMDYFFLQ